MIRIRTTLLAVVGVATTAGTAMAQDPPQAACPSGEMSEACPAPDTSTSAQTQTDTTTTTTAPVPPPTTNIEVNTMPPPEPAPVEVPVISDTEDTLEKYGVALSLGGGVSGFTQDIMRDTTNDGGAWDVRATVGTRSILSVEGEYTGSAQSIDALGLDNDAILMGNGVSGAVRLNFLDMNFQPFVFGGLGWRHYNLTNEDTVNTSDVSDSDDVLEIPMGGGIAWKYEGFMLDARGEFRYAAYEDMVPDLRIGETDGATMHRYGVNLNIGFAY